MANPYGEQIADYAWLRAGRKYWTVRSGNPFVTGENRFPIIGWKREDLIAGVRLAQMDERVRFAEKWPNVAWEEMK